MRAAIHARIFHARSWLLAIICLTAFGGCRRVTIISFHGPSSPVIDKLVVNLHGIGMKHSQELHGLDEQLGLYDLPRFETTIDISAFGCFNGAIKLINDRPPPRGYPISADAVLVTMVKFPAIDHNVACPFLDSDGGVSGEPTVADGAADSGSGGNDGGDAGGVATGMGGAGGGGLGGMPGVGGIGGVDAGRDIAGDADNTGAGGCDDAGHATTADAKKCDQPPDPPQPQTAVTPAPGCLDYCNQIVGSFDGGPPLCSGAYESIEQCQQYCTRAAWPAGTSMDMKNTMGCRLYSLADAQTLMGLHPAALQHDCEAAGPSGGLGPTSCGASNTPPGMCTTFCDALAKICPTNAAGCLSACQSAPATEPACRFPWLVRAATDQRYCALVDFAGSCLPPGC